jgi:hypothetical protein
VRELKIAEVRAHDHYLITVRFDNHHSIILDMQEKIETARFSNLSDFELFYQATTDGRAILWPNGISIATNEIVELLAK